MNHITTLEPETFGTTSHARSDGPIHGITGWPLQAGILALDDARRGFVAEFCRRSDVRWRQAVFAALASGVTDRAAEFLAGCGAGTWGCGPGDLARALLQLPPPAIVACAFGAPPPAGYLSILQRLGMQPMAEDAYLRLHRLMSDRRHGRQRRALLQLNQFSHHVLDVVERLDPLLLRPDLIRKVPNALAADRLNTLLGMIRKHVSGADDTTLAKSLSDLSGDTSTKAWARNWLAKADRNIPAPPWCGDTDVRPLLTGPDLVEVGRRTRTCLETRVPFLVMGRIAYYFAEGPEPAVCCVVRLGEDDGWLLSRIAGVRNRPVSPEWSAELRAKFRASGIFVMAEPVAEMAFARLIAAFDPLYVDELDPDGLEGC